VTRATFVLARRALRNSFRRPQFLAPLVVFPTLFLAVNTGGLSATTRLPGFPVVHGFLDFQLAAAMTQSLLLGGVSAGVAMAIEIESGFFDRLAASPVPRAALVLGRLGATAVLAMAQVSWFLAIGLIFGAHLHAGVPGVLLILITGAIAGVAFGGIGITLALRARNASTVQGIFPIVFVILFVSSAFFPSNLLEQPAKAVADFNPLSYIADGLRDPIISSITAKTVLEGMAAGAGVALVMLWLSVLSLRGKLTA
jgi:ABC-2 type transport system permease protein